MTFPVPLLEMRDVSKRFPGVRALHRVHLTLFAGEVLALVGENGAGKSTLMKVLSGVQRADSGEIRLEGQAIAIRSPRVARELGIHLVYQDLNLIPALSVVENIFLGVERRALGWLCGAQMRREANRALEQLGCGFAPETPVHRLSLAERQLVEIAKALVRSLKVLVMDEPTASLSDPEVQRLFTTIALLKAQGVGIVYISHRMAEIYHLADRVCVLRDGENIGSLQRTRAADFQPPLDPRWEGINAERVVSMMLGYPARPNPSPPRHLPGAVVLEARSVTDGGPVGRERLGPLDLKLRAGEIVGLSGLVGSGRSELAGLLGGVRLLRGGTLLLGGQRVILRSPRDAWRLGIAYLPEDRQLQGLFLELSSAENVALGTLETHTRFGLLEGGRLRRGVRQVCERLGFAAPLLSAPAHDLSGGNQQKVLLARALLSQPRVLILDEPTRGLDLSAKAEVYDTLSTLAAQGTAVLLISSEMSEILQVAHRIVVMREGRLVGELDAQHGDSVDQDHLMAYMTGLRSFSPEEWQTRLELHQLETLTLPR